MFPRNSKAQSQIGNIAIIFDNQGNEQKLKQYYRKQYQA
jgi:hypothetical protein